MGCGVGVSFSGWDWEKVKKKLWHTFWCIVIYFIWQERNHHLHGGSPRAASLILHLIPLVVRARAVSWLKDLSGLL